MYFVWKRSDGVANVTTFMPKDYTAQNGAEVTFTLVERFDTWQTDKINAAIAQARSSHQPIFQS